MEKSKIVEPTDKNKETINPENFATTLLKLALLHIILKKKNSEGGTLLLGKPFFGCTSLSTLRAATAWKLAVLVSPLWWKRERSAIFQSCFKYDLSLDY